MAGRRTFSDPTALLHWMLDTLESQPDRKTAVIAAPAYTAMSFDAIGHFQRVVAEAERVGAVRVEYGRGLDRETIQRVRLQDPKALYTYLGRRPVEDTVPAQIDRLRPLVDGAPAFIARIPDELQAAWLERRRRHQIEPGDTATAETFIRLLRGYADGLHEDVDQRTFCLRATGDTKALERGRHAGRLAAVIGQHLGIEGTSWDILETAGIRKYPTPVCFRGPLQLGDALDFSALKPYGVVAPAHAAQLTLARTPAYVMTIENFASFNRYVETITDDGLVVFAAGYPQRAIVRLLQTLDAACPVRVPFYHWGDVEEGALRAYRVIEDAVTRPVHPHRMTPELARKHGTPMQPAPRLRSLAESDSAVAGLASWLANGPDPYRLEQEALDPVPPAAVADAAE